MEFTEAIESVAKSLDAAGVAIIALGFVWATIRFGGALRNGESGRQHGFQAYRQSIGGAILLGLEVLVAADIIRTVAIEPTFRSVGVLALIVLVRTFLSFTLELELTGRWPWQQGAPTDVASKN